MNKLNHEGSEHDQAAHTGIGERMIDVARTSSTMQGANVNVFIASPDQAPIQGLDPLLRTSEAFPGCAGQDLKKKRGKKSSPAVLPGR